MLYAHPRVMLLYQGPRKKSKLSLYLVFLQMTRKFGYREKHKGEAE